MSGSTHSAVTISSLSEWVFVFLIAKGPGMKLVTPGPPPLGSEQEFLNGSASMPEWDLRTPTLTWKTA